MFDLIRIYSELTKNCSINKLGENILFYLADELNTNILARNVIEIDMISAFPKICRMLFYETEPEFIDQLELITDKLERNIFLTNYLKEKTDRNYLIDLNNYAKILTLSYIYNNYDNVNILEFKKDGAIFTAVQIKPKYEELNQFNSENNFQYRINNIALYSRYNKTSLFYKDSNLDIKGQYKSPPEFVFDKIMPTILNGKELSPSLLSIYSSKFFNILKLAQLYQEIKYYYSFGNNRYITKLNKLENGFQNIEPFLVLKNFVFPFLALLKLEK